MSNTKAKAARAIFDALCELTGEEGTRAKRAVDEVGESVGAEGFKCLREGDAVGCVVEVLRNVRAKKKRAPRTE